MQVTRNKKQKEVTGQRGFALLFSIFVAILIVAIGASIISIALRQTILSSTSRESQYAFYAANTAIECAFFHDLRSPEAGQAVFPHVFGGETRISNTARDTLNCAGTSIAQGGTDASDPAYNFITGITGTSGSETWLANENMTTFRFKIGNSVDPNKLLCVEVKVTKANASPPASGTIAVIEAKGYNTCDLSDPRTVERGLILTYTF